MQAVVLRKKKEMKTSIPYPAYTTGSQLISNTLFSGKTATILIKMTKYSKILINVSMKEAGKKAGRIAAKKSRIITDSVSIYVSSVFKN